jgi:hypothetical protein
MYAIQFFTLSGYWSFYFTGLTSQILDPLIEIVEEYNQESPRYKRRIIDLNTGAIVYT